MTGGTDYCEDYGEDHYAKYLTEVVEENVIVLGDERGGGGGFVCQRKLVGMQGDKDPRCVYVLLVVLLVCVVCLCVPSSVCYFFSVC